MIEKESNGDVRGWVLLLDGCGRYSYRWLDLAAARICSSAVLLAIIWEDERRKNSLGKMLLRSVGEEL